MYDIGTICVIGTISVIRPCKQSEGRTGARADAQCPSGCPSERLRLNPAGGPEQSQTCQLVLLDRWADSRQRPPPPRVAEARTGRPALGGPHASPVGRRSHSKNLFKLLQLLGLLGLLGLFVLLGLFELLG